MRSKANERALRYLGVKELNIGHLPEGAEIVNLPNQVSSPLTDAATLFQVSVFVTSVLKNSSYVQTVVVFFTLTDRASTIPSTRQ